MKTRGWGLKMRGEGVKRCIVAVGGRWAVIGGGGDDVGHVGSGRWAVVGGGGGNVAKRCGLSKKKKRNKVM